MQQIKKLYRENYTGEDIVTSLTWENSQWNAVKEFAPSRIENKQISGRAVVIGNGTGAVTTVSPGTSGNVVYSNGTNWIDIKTGLAVA